MANKKAQQYAKAFFDWLPFRQVGDAFDEGEPHITKDLVEWAAIVEIRHHDEEFGSWFEEQYWFSDDGTCYVHAQSCSDCLWEDDDFGDGFEASKEGMRINELYDMTRILANIKDAAKLMSTLPSLEETFAKIAKSD